jgi:glutaredoxin 3
MGCKADFLPIVQAWGKKSALQTAIRQEATCASGFADLSSVSQNASQERTMQAVKMYTTAVCPFCTQAKQILRAKGVTQIEEIRVDANAQALQEMMALTKRRTVPQIFIGTTHVGGCDDLQALDSRGGLLPLLNA